MVIALGRAALPGQLPGWIGTASIALAFACSIGALLALLDHPVDERQLTDSLYSYASRPGSTSSSTSSSTRSRSTCAWW